MKNIKNTKTRLIYTLVQILLWFLVLVTPVIIQILSGASIGVVFETMRYYYPSILLFPIIFYLNYFVLIPCFLFRKKNWLYFLLNVFSLTFLYYLMGFYLKYLQVNLTFLETGFYLGIISGITIVNMLLIMSAIAIKSQQRNAQFELKEAENQRQQSENELQQLKSQLNPHFLFNTLNNISSLAAFDPELTQDSISRLSEMLRYVLYDSSEKTVPLSKEIDFMQNYIDLMKLRYTDTLDLETEFPVEKTDTQVAPLLFISLLENAFKYGAGSQQPCFIHLSLTETDQAVTFSLTNSILPPEERDKQQKGGVGLENLKKRLQLLYPGFFQFKYGEVMISDQKDKPEMMQQKIDSVISEQNSKSENTGQINESIIHPMQSDKTDRIYQCFLQIYKTNRE